MKLTSCFAEQAVEDNLPDKVSGRSKSHPSAATESFTPMKGSASEIFWVSQAMSLFVRVSPCF